MLRAVAGPSGVVANVGWGREVADRELFRAVAAATGYGKQPTHAADRRGDIARVCLHPPGAQPAWGWRAAPPLPGGVGRGGGDAPGKLGAAGEGHRGPRPR